MIELIVEHCEEGLKMRCYINGKFYYSPLYDSIELCIGFLRISLLSKEGVYLDKQNFSVNHEFS